MKSKLSLLFTLNAIEADLTCKRNITVQLLVAQYKIYDAVF